MQKSLFGLLSLGLVASATLVLQIETFDEQRRTTSIQKHWVGSNARIAQAYGKLPLSFESNRGQVDSEVKFLAQGSGYGIFLTANEVVLVLQKPSANDKETTRSGMGPDRVIHAQGPAKYLASAPSGQRDESSVLRMKLVGAKSDPVAAGLDELPGKSHYFVGNDPAKWRTNVPTYGKVQYEDVYPGIDLVYYGNQRQVEFDFVVAPGSDPSVIQFAFDGRAESSIDAEGDLLIESADGSNVRLRKPEVYQESDGARQEIAGNYPLRSDGAVGFRLASYDASRPLIIDPVLSYSTFLGAASYGIGFGIAVDASGNAYVTGSTGGGAFVTKLNAAGSAVVYTTTLVGMPGEVSTGTSGSGIAVDSSGNAYVTGSTGSPTFPTMNAFDAVIGEGICNNGVEEFPCTDGFVAKLNATGSLVYSTYLGGRSDDLANGIAVDAFGNAYVTGSTRSFNFPTSNAFQPTKGAGQVDPGEDAFVTKFNATGSAVVYSTYLGGAFEDFGSGIAVDFAGSAYITGYTNSTNFPRANALQPAYGGGPYDVFITKFNASGSALAYSTYLGGNGEDYGFGIAVDSTGNAYIAGSAGPNFPRANAFQSVHGGEAFDAFVTKVNASGAALVYSTYLGGNSYDDGYAIAVDSTGNAYVGGTSYSTNFPTANAFQSSKRAGICGNPPDTGPCPDGIVAKLNAAGSTLGYSTYLGGDRFDEVFGIAVDSSGNAYVTGMTFATDFPTANALFPKSNGSVDVFLTKVSGPPAIVSGSVVNGASFAAGAPVAAGSIASLFGSNLASAASGGVSVRAGGTPAFLYYVSPTQINFQVPWEVLGQVQAPFTVTVEGASTSPVTVNLAAASPGIFRISQDGQGAILIATTGQVAAPVGSIPGLASRPAIRGVDFISIYCTGLGDVTNRPAIGGVAGINPPSSTTSTPSVTVGGVPTTVDFSGLAPGFVGLNQINVRVPANAAVGPAVPVVVSVGGTSDTATIAVR